jgi:hypothetical protein
MKKKEIKQSVLNSFKRVGIDVKAFDNTKRNVIVYNWLSAEPATTTELMRTLILWVYATQLRFERGDKKTRLDDFDRIRYFVLEQDENAYMTCLD